MRIVVYVAIFSVHCQNLKNASKNALLGSKMNSILIKNETCQTLYIIKKEGEHKSIHFSSLL